MSKTLKIVPTNTDIKYVVLNIWYLSSSVCANKRYVYTIFI